MKIHDIIISNKKNKSLKIGGDFMVDKNKWLPTGIDKIRESFVFNAKKVLKSNIAYNIQYLQYLYRDINSSDSTTVLYRMRYKSFVITGMSIIEAVFMALLKDRKLIPLEEWKEVGNHKHQKIDDKTINVIIKRKKVSPFEKKIKFDEAITLIEKNNVLNLDKSSIVVIRKLQDLRNHLHLDKAEELCSSDYNCFNEKIYFIMKLVLYYILANENVSNDESYLDFLRPLKTDFDKYILQSK